MGDEDALGVHAVQDDPEALVLHADQVLDRNPQVVVEDLVGLVVDHGLDRPDGHALAYRFANVHQQHRQAVGALRALVHWRGAHQQRHEVGVERPRSPDLLAVHDIVVAIAHRARLQVQRVGPGGRFGHAEGLEANLAGRDAGQVLVLLRLRAVLDQHLHHVHLRADVARSAARRADLLEDHAAGAQGQSRSAVLLRNQRRQVARLGHRLGEFRGMLLLGFLVAPVLPGEVLADRLDGTADLREVLPVGDGGQVVGVQVLRIAHLLTSSFQVPGHCPRQARADSCAAAGACR